MSQTGYFLDIIDQFWKIVFESFILRLSSELCWILIVVPIEVVFGQSNLATVLS